MSSLTADDPIPVAVPAPAVESDEGLYEIIDGQRVELPPMGIFASLVAFELSRLVGNFAEAQNLGRAVTEGLFHLALPVDRNRRPDAAYVSYERWPKGRAIGLRDNAWDVVPDLAVEVISPSDLAEDLIVRIDEYFRSGVRLVWVIYPALRLLYIYESLFSVRVLAHNDEVDGGAVLPGFRRSVASFFPAAEDA